MAPADQKPDLIKDEALVLLKTAATEQIESLQLMLDAAVLAVEQIQDKRLELLEEGPEVTTGDIVWEFGIVLLLEANVAGLVLQKITRKALAGRIQQKRLLQAITNARMREAAQPIKTLRPFTVSFGSNIANLITAQEAAALRERGAIVRAVADIVKGQRMAAEAVTSAEIRSLNRWIRALRVLGDESRGGFDALIKATRAANQQSEQAEFQRIVQRPGALDTPGVSVLDQVQQYASSHRIAVQAEAAHLEMLVRAELITPDQLVQLDFMSPQTLVVDGQAVSHSDAKEAWKRHFEALIWTLILKERPFKGKATSRDWKERFARLSDHVPENFLTYMLRRFINPQTARPFSEIGALTNPYSGQKIERAVGMLGQYMTEIAKKAETDGARILVAGEFAARKTPA